MNLDYKIDIRAKGAFDGDKMMLSHVIKELFAEKDNLPTVQHAAIVSQEAIFKFQGIVLAQRCYGVEAVEAVPSLVNCAALALTMERLVLHQMKRGASALVNETKLHSLPSTCPRILSKSFLFEVRDRGKDFLFGKTFCLGGYWIGNECFLLGLQDEGDSVGGLVGVWRPQWSQDILSGTEQPAPGEFSKAHNAQMAINIKDVEGHQAWCREAAAFAVTAALCLEAKQSPFYRREERLQPAKSSSPSKTRGAGWVIQHVYVSEEPKKRTGSTEKHEPAPPAEGMVLQTVSIETHLRRQHYGPRTMPRTEWIWVRAHEKKTWVVDAPKKVVVH